MAGSTSARRIDLEPEGIRLRYDRHTRPASTIACATTSSSAGRSDTARSKPNFDRNGGRLDIESWNASLFGTYFSDDKFYVDAQLSYGDNAYDSFADIVYTDTGGTVDLTRQRATATA